MKINALFLSAVIAVAGLGISRPVWAAGSFNCLEYKQPVSGKSGKEAATDIPSWAKGYKPCKNPNENGTAFAKRLMDINILMEDIRPAQVLSSAKLKNSATVVFNNFLWSIK